MEDRPVDLLYLACNRLEFTRETFTSLLANTDWPYVRQLFVYDDGSVDGTREWLADAARQAPSPVRLEHTAFGSPVSAMLHFILSARAPMLAKTDNDAMLPPGWLRQSLNVFERHAELSLLGIEAMYPHSSDPGLPRSYAPAEFVSGLGLYRRAAFERSRPRPIRKWFGLEEWQTGPQGRGIVRGWITPALPVFLLDRMPLEPWVSYSARYQARGWQRSWPKYDPACTLWQWRWPSGNSAPAAAGEALHGAVPADGGGDPGLFRVVIPSKTASNFAACTAAILKNEPSLAPERIVAVDDGIDWSRFAPIPPAPAAGREFTVRSGEKPFVFARNANIGFRAAGGSDVILLNDDALLESPLGFSALAREARAHPEFGIIAAVTNSAGNPAQSPRNAGLREEPRMVCFVCVYIPRRTIDTVGFLDERFTGYGLDDDDYCLRVRRAGLKIGIFDGCFVDHARLRSSYREAGAGDYRPNLEIFKRKWGIDNWGRPARAKWP